jgi:2-polyprenyl-3-methyl-5-hydroxy-6-metoxy-1,4-benzoquinol methylase
MTKVNAIKDTGERMIPEFHKGDLIYAEHLTRYLCAQDLVDGKVVLDIACGSGYGTQLLAKKAKKVYGVDVDKDTVEYAKKNFGATNVVYKLGDGVAIPLDDNSVDVVVTLETIEHIENYDKFIDEVKRVLKPDGLAIVSTPNDLEFAEGNHYHVHEFEYKELKQLLKKDFKFVDSYYQATWKYVAIGKQELMESETKTKLDTLNLAPLKPDQYLYFYMLCSNRGITEKIEPLAALGGHYSDRRIAKERGVQQEHTQGLETVIKNHEETMRNLNVELQNIKNSKSYRLARSLAKAKSRVKGG